MTRLEGKRGEGVSRELDRPTREERVTEGYGPGRRYLGRTGPLTVRHI